MKCPLCYQELGSKPEFYGVGLANSAFLDCENGHALISFSAMTNNWNTKSASVARKLSKRGVKIYKQGNVYSFDDNPILFESLPKKDKKWWHFWK